MSDKALKNYIETAYDSECPKDQVENFLKAKYYAYPWQLLFHAAAREADKRCEAHQKDQTLPFDGTCGCGPVEIGLGGARGPGKQIADYEQVLTDSGWKRADSVTESDQLVTKDGSFTKLKGIYFSPVKDFYRVTFLDGATCDVDGRHLWEVKDLKKGKTHVYTTQTLIDKGVRTKNGCKWAIPLLEKPFVGKYWSSERVDPYIVGYMLGNGTLTGKYPTIYTIEDELVEQLKASGWNSYRYEYSTCYQVQIAKKWGEAYRELLGRHIGADKKVPDQLLNAQPVVRLAVLQGLLDSDGSCDKDGRIEFKSVSKQLAENVQYITRSLGGMATLSKQNREDEDGVIGNKGYIYRVKILHCNKFNPFRLERKARRVTIKKTHTQRTIRSIEKIPNHTARCFEVEHPSHLFVTKGFVLTHNSHAVLSQVGLDDVQRVPKLKALFLRQTGSAAKESFEDVIERALSGRADYDYVNNTLKFPNRSKVILGGFYTERDIDKYVGIEYDLIIIEELNQLTKEKYIRLKGSLRTSKPDWRPRVYASFNPGGIGHGFVKETFVQPYRDGIQTTSRFIPSTYKENPALNAEYIQYLESLEGYIGKAWREGEWDLFAGQFFNTWKYDVHVCEPFKIPDDWKKVIAIDYGYAAQSSVGWWAISPDNQVFRYRELYKTKLTYRQLTEEIVALTPDNEYISYWVADPAIWAKKGESDLSGAEVMKARYRELQKDKNRTRPIDLKPLQQELNLIKGVNDRMSGWDVMREYMSVYPDQDGNPTARLQVFSTCTDFHRTIPSLVHDEHRVEDLDTTQEDHQADEARYFLMSQPVPHETRNAAEERRFKLRMKQKKVKSRGTTIRNYGRT